LKIWPLLLASAWVASANAAEPLNLKGMAPGSPSTRIVQDPRFDCRNTTTPTADLVCTLLPKQQETLAGVTLHALYYFFDRGRLTGIVASLPESEFRVVTKALENKYGNAVVKKTSIKTLDGKAHENHSLSWQQGPVKLTAERYAGQINRSIIRLTDTTAAERIRLRKTTPPAQDL
jgi:hypothetical protein